MYPVVVLGLGENNPAVARHESLLRRTPDARRVALGFCVIQVRPFGRQCFHNLPSMTTTPTPPRVLNLGIFGAGTVGGGVVDICIAQKAFFESLGQCLPTAMNN